MTWFSQRSPIVLVDVLLNCVHGDARHTLYSHMGRFWACGLVPFTSSSESTGLAWLQPCTSALRLEFGPPNKEPVIADALLEMIDAALIDSPYPVDGSGPTRLPHHIWLPEFQYGSADSSLECIDIDLYGAHCVASMLRVPLRPVGSEFVSHFSMTIITSSWQKLLTFFCHGCLPHMSMRNTLTFMIRQVTSTFARVHSAMVRLQAFHV
jgi:hypothetical protein